MEHHGYLLDVLERANPDAAELSCVDDWTVKDLLAVRAWWTEKVVDWIEAGVFDWAGKWPIARWVSLNTARHYTTARTFIRRALRERGTSTR